MLARVEQPPIDPARRDPERHEFLPGFILALIGLCLLLQGALHSTRIDTKAGGRASEAQLVKAFSSGGLELMKPPSPPDLANLEDPNQAAAIIRQWEESQAQGFRPRYQINTGAKNPCPT